MNAYSKNYNGHKLSNTILQMSWTMEKFPLAAEIICYSNAGWSDSVFAQFKKMLGKYKKELLPTKNVSNGNWLLSRLHFKKVRQS
jgi:hypothetical protein